MEGPILFRGRSPSFIAFATASATTAPGGRDGRGLFKSGRVFEARMVKAVLFIFRILSLNPILKFGKVGMLCNAA